MSPLSSTDLALYRARIARERLLAGCQIDRLEAERRQLLAQALEEESDRVKRALARQVNEINRQVEMIAHTRAMLEKRELLAYYLIYAQESGDPLDRPPFSGLDLPALLQHFAEQRRLEAAEQRRLDELLQTLSHPQPPRIEPVTEPRPKPKPRRKPVEGELALAVSVPDGDGLKLEDGRKVRYIGINAPEMHPWGAPGPEPYAREAKTLNRGLVEGQVVRLVKDVSETDHYGRLLRFVYVGDVFVNAELLKSGLAEVMTVPPDEKMRDEFLRIEAQARSHRRGMWAVM